jgi:hypothetical protein
MSKHFEQKQNFIFCQAKIQIQNKPIHPLSNPLYNIL